MLFNFILMSVDSRGKVNQLPDNEGRIYVIAVS